MKPYFYYLLTFNASLYLYLLWREVVRYLY